MGASCYFVLCVKFHYGVQNTIVTILLFPRVESLVLA